MGDVVEMKAVKVGKKVELDVLERLTLSALLPKEGTFLNLRLLRVIKEELSFTEEENRALQFRQITQGDQQMLVWNTIAVVNKETGETVRAPNELLVQMVTKDPEAFEQKPAYLPKEFVFGEVMEGIIVKTLKDLDKAEKLTADHYSLYEKFMEGHEENPDGETRH